MRDFLKGNHAAAYGAKLARPQVIAAYPITPQSPIYEKLSEWDGAGTLGARMMRVESEHSAMAACISASLTGVRTFTATASQGLALMHELLHFASGMRVPIVMVNVNRSLAAPWSFWSDQTDSLSQRDTGWLQFYVADNQEALDTVIQAFRISETVYLPSMVVLEAFLMGGAGHVIGMGCGLFLSYFLIFVVNKQSFGWTFLYEVPPWTVVTSFILILFAAALAAIPSANKASRVNLAELLKTQ